MTFNEFKDSYLGLGLLSGIVLAYFVLKLSKPCSAVGVLLPIDITLGTLIRNGAAPDRLDFADSDCSTSVKDQGGCNSCAAHSTIATVEYCLCKAFGNISSESRSVQQLSECTDGRVLDG